MECRVRPLDGIAIIGLEQAIGTPFCMRQLANVSVRIVEVERTGADDFARNMRSRVAEDALAGR